MTFPDGIDPQTKLCDLTDDQLQSIMAHVMAKRRWEGVSKKRKRQHGLAMAGARMAKMTPDERKEVARLGGLASAKARKAKESAP